MVRNVNVNTEIIRQRRWSEFIFHIRVSVFVYLKLSPVKLFDYIAVNTKREIRSRLKSIKTVTNFEINVKLLFDFALFCFWVKPLEIDVYMRCAWMV